MWKQFVGTLASQFPDDSDERATLGQGGCRISPLALVQLCALNSRQDELRKCQLLRSGAINSTLIPPEPKGFARSLFPRGVHVHTEKRPLVSME
jgi:hypothetical protein